MGSKSLVTFIFFLSFCMAIQLPQCTSNCSVSNCAICNNTTCTSCLLGYSLSFNACTINACSVANCSLCDFQGACIQCTDPYSTFNSSVGSCIQTCAISNCAKCKIGSKVCQVCSNGYARYQWNDQCIPSIILNCQIIYDFQQQEFLCSKCATGLKPTQDQTECIVDNSNCSSITDCTQCNGSVCLTCRNGYSPSNSSTACISNPCNISRCLYCGNDGICLRCLSNNTLINNTCSIATCNISGCSVCKPNSQFCDVCLNGYMLNIWTRQCQNMTNNINNITNCLSFMIDSSNQLRCVSCDLGLVPSTDRFSCIANCPSGCLNCTNSSNCSSCYPGYSFSQGNCTINVCSSSHCILCSSNQTCLQCDDYSTLSNGTCKAACSLPYCSLCKHHSQECEQCASGYTVNNWNKKCFTPPIEGCKIVLDYAKQEFICTQCEHGLLPSSDQLACVPNCTILNCNNCATSLCSSCRQGYKLVQDKSCTLISCSVSNCLLCESSKKCIKCKSNYTLSSGQCSMAQCSLPNCQTCKTGSIFCDSCSNGYAFNIWSGACEQLLFPITNCIAFRKDSSNQNRCVQCSNQLIPSSDAFSCVINCPTHCLACSNGQCTACENGFYLKNSSCVAYICSSDCQVCDSKGVCLTCLNPEQSYNSLLKLCQSSCSLPNCISCLPNSQICSQCATGYALYEWNSQCKLSIIANCKSQYDFRGQQYLCSKCQTGYVPTSDQTQCMLASCQTIDNCQACNSSICSSCRLGYYLSSDKTTCSPSPCNAANCLYCGSSNSTCLRCSSSFILINGQCQKSYCILPFCSSCKQKSQFCDLCNAGYTWNVWTNQCQKSIITNCDSQGSINRVNYQCFACLVNQTCNQCNSIYTFQNSSNLCSPTCNISNCGKCMTSQLCSECANGFVLDQNFLACRLQCSVTNCAKCLTSNSICDKCAIGYVLANNACQEDVCKLDNCLTCVSASFCGSCLPMFTVSQNGTCVSICPISNCRVCSSYITCESCNIGYVPISPYQCSPICSISNCLLCSDSSSCAVCADGFSLSANKNTCNVKCLSSNCAQCQRLDSCITCIAGFTVVIDDFGKGICVPNGCSIGFYPNSTNSSQCLTCSLAGCDICQSATTCSLCKPTYYLNNVTCTICSSLYSNCLVCNEMSCLQCQQGYIKNGQNSCVMLGNCSSGCISSSNGTCLECSLAYYLNINKLCTPKCANGEYTSSGCTCQPGLYMSNSICTPCRNAKCLSCDQIKCTKCIAGYYPLMNTCLTCMQNCESCTSRAICDKCKLGFTLSENICKFDYLNPVSTNQCPFGCSECAFFNRVPYCTKLSDGFSFSPSSAIVQCNNPCKTCASNNASLCLSCYSGLLNYGTCSSCNDPNCQSCSDPFYCSICKPTYTLSSGVCLSCSSSCLRCNIQGAGLCDDEGCIEGYTALSSSYVCVKCVNGCATCSSSDFTLCQSCTYGTYLSNGACLSCLTGCSSCYSQTFCQQCSNGYSLRSGVCYTNPQLPCEMNDANNNCIGCINNYQLVNGTCQLNVSSVCASNCSKCPLNYYLVNFTCQSCPSLSKCLQCDSSNVNACLKCMSGYYWSGTACSSCADNCQICSSATKCSHPKAGYYLTKDGQNILTGLVSKCRDLCAACRDEKHCTSCNPSWKLFGVQCVSLSSINVSLVIIPSFITWDQSWSATQQQSNAIKNWPQIYAKIQQLLKLNSSGNDVLMTRSLVFGSINVQLTRIVGDNENAANVQLSMASSIQAGTPGLNVLSSNLISQPNNNSDNKNALYIGLFVGLGGIIIVVIVIIFCYIHQRKKKSAIVNVEQDGRKGQIKLETGMSQKINNQFVEIKNDGNTEQMGIETGIIDNFTPKKTFGTKRQTKREKKEQQICTTEEQVTNNKLLVNQELDKSPQGKLHARKLKPISHIDLDGSPVHSRGFLIEGQFMKQGEIEKVQPSFNKSINLQSINEIDKKKQEEGIDDMEVEFNIDNPGFK